MATKRNIVLSASVAVAAVCAVPVNAASLISNGDFEADAAGSPTITNWVVEETSANGVQLRDGESYIPCCGATGSDLDNKFISFGAGQSAVGEGNRISQLFSISNAGIFNLRFDAAAVGAGGQPLGFRIFDIAAGVFALNGTTDILTASNNFDTTFSTFSSNFSASSAGQYRLDFFGFPPTNNVDVLVDNVSVSAVPEPGTWAMLLLGFGFVGAALRTGKRRTKVSVAYA